MKTLVAFTATWCGPCQMLKPILKELQQEGYDIIVADIDEYRDMALKFNVNSVPSIFIVQNDKVIDQHIGFVPKQLLLQKLQ